MTVQVGWQNSNIIRVRRNLMMIRIRQRIEKLELDTVRKLRDTNVELIMSFSDST